MFPQQRHSIQKFFLIHPAGAAEHNGSGVLNLVVEKLTEVFHINFALCGIGDSDESVEYNLVVIQALDGSNDIGQLAHARGLNENPVRVKLIAFSKNHAMDM